MRCRGPSITTKRLYEDLRRKADPTQKNARLALHHLAPRNTFLSSRALHTAFAAPGLVKNTKDILAVTHKPQAT
jgi:hypothetical protein